MNTMPPRFRSAILGLCAAAVSAPGGSILASDDAGVLRTLIAADLSERTARVAGVHCGEASDELNKRVVAAASQRLLPAPRVAIDCYFVLWSV